MGLPFKHVFDVPEFEMYRTSVVGQTQVPDTDIAQHAADNQLVLITFDNDFRAKWVRLGVLAKCGVEVIVLPQVPGLDGQLLKIAQGFPHWLTTLGKQPYSYRVWSHNRRSSIPQLRKKP
jgi:hypothetical protein